MLIQHKKPAWVLFFTWEIARMSFKSATKAIEQLPRLVVMIPGFHSLSKYPLKLPLWFVNHPPSYFLRDIITTNKNVESLGRSEDSGFCTQGLSFSGVCMGYLLHFLEMEKRASGFATLTSLLFSQYTPDLSKPPGRKRSSKHKKPHSGSPIPSAQHFTLWGISLLLVGLLMQQGVFSVRVVPTKSHPTHI